jgi:hypothetical protein
MIRKAFLITFLIFANQMFSQKYGSLVITEVCVVDNGQGMKGDHAPYSNLHVRVYDANEPIPSKSSNYPTGMCPDKLLAGPDWDGDKYEWLDCRVNGYNDIFVFQWRNEDDSVKILIFESDPSYELPNKEHNAIFCRVISRKQFSHGPALFKGDILVNCDDGLDKSNIEEVKEWFSLYWPQQLNENICNLY